MTLCLKFYINKFHNSEGLTKFFKQQGVIKYLTFQNVRAAALLSRPVSINVFLRDIMVCCSL